MNKFAFDSPTTKKTSYYKEVMNMFEDEISSCPLEQYPVFLFAKRRKIFISPCTCASDHPNRSEEIWKVK